MYKLLTINEAADYLGVSVSHLRQNIKDDIGYTRVGIKIMFKLDDLQQYVDRNYSPAKTQDDEPTDR